MEHFERLPQIVAIVERSERRAVGVTVEGVPVELVVAEPERFGTELVRATGSRAYVDALEPLPDAPDEEGVYAALGIPFCPPELREEPFRGEPPPLVELGDIRGDLHVHTDWSDGKATVLEMGEAALARGYEYLAICDHTRNVRVVPGLDADDVRRQGEEIAAANEVLAPFRILRGIECDILPDGSLDLPDDVLAELEWVQASVHAGQRAPAAELTKRTVEAMRHPAVRCLSHPKGRIINHRPENALDLERVFEVALETGVAVEVNGLAPRLDLRDVHVRARRRGRRADRLLDGRPLGARPREHAALGGHSPPRLGDGSQHREHAPPVPNSQALARPPEQGRPRRYRAAERWASRHHALSSLGRFPHGRRRCRRYLPRRSSLARDAPWRGPPATRGIRQVTGTAREVALRPRCTSARCITERRRILAVAALGSEATTVLADAPWPASCSRPTCILDSGEWATEAPPEMSGRSRTLREPVTGTAIGWSVRRPWTHAPRATTMTASRRAYCSSSRRIHHVLVDLSDISSDWLVG